jgi:benzylsuccinate CoA-transferase BbsE subunit
MTALNGLLVVELCGERGQYMGKLMGDMGARVVKIEPLQGSPERNIGPFKDDKPDPNSSLYFWARNTSKESLTVDLESPKGIAIVKKLLKKADVFLEDRKPGFLESLGLGYEVLKKAKELVMTSLTAFGQDGPYRDYKSNDLVALVMGGIMHSCGYDDVPDSPPIRPSSGHGDFISAHYGLIGTMSALFYRDFTGVGQYLDVSAHEACSSTKKFSVRQEDIKELHQPRKPFVKPWMVNT